MTNDCKQKVETMLINGNTHDFIIAQKILKFKELSHKIKNIIDFSKMVEKPLSTTSRFINKLGYKSFKHFIFEFNGYDGNEIKKDKELNTFWSYGLQKIDEISKKIQGKIFVMSSKKTKSIAFYLYYSFQNIKVNCEFFDGKISELEDWLNQIGPNDTLIMISMSGTSNRFTSALHFLQKHHKSNCFSSYLILVTSKKFYKFPVVFDYINPLVNIKKAYKFDNFLEFNNAVLKTIEMLNILINFYYSNHILKKKSCINKLFYDNK